MRRPLPVLLRLLITLLLTATGLAILTDVGLGSGRHGAAATESAPATRHPAAARRPDIVFVLLDDASLNLFKYMPRTQRLARQGASFENSFVTDSLCCPSRAATFLGRYPHQTKVFGNVWGGSKVPLGGWRAFKYWNGPRQAFNVSLHRRGYTTGFMGKYLNSYSSPSDEQQDDVDLPRVPGWDQFNEYSTGGTSGWGFRRSHIAADGSFRYGRYLKTPSIDATRTEKDKSYATNVMAQDAVEFLDRHEDDAKPYFLELAPYAPHARRAHDPDGCPGEPAEPPAMYDRPGARFPTGNCGTVPCGQVTVEDLPGFDDPRGDNVPFDRKGERFVPAKPWRTNPPSRFIKPKEALARHRDRIMMVQSVDRMIGRVSRAIGPNTYLFITSDNGYHLGQYQLNAGKGTPYVSDVDVPLYVIGPKVAAGERHQFVTNVDLAPTFEDLAGVEPAGYRAGTSFADALSDPRSKGARYAFFEHTYLKMGTGPDAESERGGTTNMVPSYIAVRGPLGLLARFDMDDSRQGVDYAWEAYSYANRSWEKTNSVRRLWDRPWMQNLHHRLLAFEGCVANKRGATRGQAVCRSLTR